MAITIGAAAAVYDAFLFQSKKVSILSKSGAALVDGAITAPHLWQKRSVDIFLLPHFGQLVVVISLSLY